MMAYPRRRSYRLAALLPWCLLAGLGLELAVAQEPKPAEGKGAQRLGHSDAMAGEEVKQGQRYALLIGVNDYKSMPALRYCVRDMETYQEVLTEYAGYRPENVHLLTDDAEEKPTLSNIYSTLNRICKRATPEDTVFVAFSGHGELDDEGYAYLMPPAGSPDVLDYSCVAVSRMHKLLEASAAREKIVVLDACHAAGKKGSGGFGLKKDPVPQGMGFVELLSCRADQSSWEYEEKQQGVYSYYFVNAIVDGDADREPYGNNDGYVSVQEIHRYVSKKLDEYGGDTGRTQTPVLRGEQSHEIRLARIRRLARGRNTTPGEPRVDPAMARLLTLPGLSGQWWFDEMPWLAPQVRRALTKSPDVAQLVTDRHVVAKPSDDKPLPIAAKSEILGPDIASVRARLDEAFRQCLSTGGLSIAERQAWDRFYRVRWDRIGREDAEYIVRDASRLNDPHLMALVHHKLGNEEAETAYELALRGYGPGGNQAAGLTPRESLSLQTLCLADQGWWQFNAGQHRQAVYSFDQARSNLRTGDIHSPLFSIVCRSRKAWAQRKLGKFEEVNELMEKAFAEAEQHLVPRHPLRAFLHERRAWALMDQWRCDEAEKDFDAAYRLRLELLKSDLTAAESWSRVSCFHNQHGLAMSKRFAGHVEESRTAYEKLRHEIVAEIQERLGGYPTADYATRLENTIQRLADTYLFAHNPQPETARAHLRDAYQITKYLPPDVRPRVRGKLLCKQAIASALLDQPERVERELQRFDRLPLSQSNRDSEQLCRDVAEALAGLRSNNQDAAEKSRNRVRDILIYFTLDATENASTAYESIESRDTLRRELFELLLLAWSQLLQSGWDGTELNVPADQFRQDVEIVYDLVPWDPFLKVSRTPFQKVKAENTPRQSPGILRFLRPYYEMAIEAELAAVPSAQMHQTVGHFRLAATGSNFHFRPRQGVLLFHLASEQGYALLYLPNADDEVFALDFAHAAVQEGEEISLPPVLLDRLKKSDQEVVMVWQHDMPIPEALPDQLRVVEDFLDLP